MFRKFGVGLVVVSFLLMAGETMAAKRVALIIGNDSYTGLPRLNNARTDARGMNKKLKSLGFDTVLALNSTLQDLGQALGKFEDKLSNADVGLVFYAGHGIQANGENYLIPVDAELKSERDLRFGGGVALSEVIGSMKRSGSALNLIILDACRNNPLPTSGRSTGASRGLAVSSVPAGLGLKGTAILYSAAPGQIAQDGPKGGHSVFTGALLKVISTPGIPVEQVFKKTAALVSQSTYGKQEPWMNSSIKGDFYFKAGKAPSNAVRFAPSNEGGQSAEIVFWQTIEGSDDAAMFEAYLEQYPEGSFTALARVKVKKYTKPAAPSYEVASIDKTMWVAKNKSVNVRSGPGTKYDKVGRLKGHGRVSVTGDVKSSDWVRVALASGDTGYVYQGLLVRSKPISKADEQKAAQELANLKSYIKRMELEKKTPPVRTSMETASHASSGRVIDEPLYRRCTGCHGRKGEKKALGKSNIIKNVSSDILLKRMIGYKNGTYGGPMKVICKAQMINFSMSQMRTLAEAIGKR